MNNTLLVQNLRPLPRAGRVRLGAQIDRLHRVCAGDSALEPFLEELLDVMGRIFGAAAGAFWFRPWGAAGLCPSVRIGFAELPFNNRGLHAIDAAVSAHWQSPEPAVQSYADHASTVLIGPIRDGQEAIGAMQLVIIDNQWDSSPEFASGSGTNFYARALDAVMSIIQPALLKRMRVRTIPIEQADAGLDQLSQQVAGIQRSLRIAIDAIYNNSAVPRLDLWKIISNMFAASKRCSTATGYEFVVPSVVIRQSYAAHEMPAFRAEFLSSIII